MQKLFPGAIAVIGRAEKISAHQKAKWACAGGQCALHKAALRGIKLHYAALHGCKFVGLISLLMF
jgi:hypothetical protein